MGDVWWRQGPLAGKRLADVETRAMKAQVVGSLYDLTDGPRSRQADPPGSRAGRLRGKRDHGGPPELTRAAQIGSATRSCPSTPRTRARVNSPTLSVLLIFSGGSRRTTPSISGASA
jgi:hypothetical protein